MAALTSPFFEMIHFGNFWVKTKRGGLIQVETEGNSSIGYRLTFTRKNPEFKQLCLDIRGVMFKKFNQNVCIFFFRDKSQDPHFSLLVIDLTKLEVLHTIINEQFVSQMGGFVVGYERGQIICSCTGRSDLVSRFFVAIIDLPSKTIIFEKDFPGKCNTLYSKNHFYWTDVEIAEDKRSIFLVKFNPHTEDSKRIFLAKDIPEVQYCVFHPLENCIVV